MLSSDYYLRRINQQEQEAQQMLLSVKFLMTFLLVRSILIASVSTSSQQKQCKLTC